ncbi:MAG TPA: carboxypeptidase-like regulatory domain-containing protein [Lacipirellulaceae bacterium]|nr:carboxypeptidase-like regulatory domain-containing protein [Lacipirellulaceae bacterium]
MIRILFAVAVALALPASTPAEPIAAFPGVESLIEKSDAIVILRVDRQVQPDPGPDLLTTHECYIYQSLKGPTPKNQKITLRLMDPQHLATTPFSVGSTHLAFLIKKRSPDEPTDYRTLDVEGADIRLAPTGHEKLPVGNTVLDQVRSLIVEAMEFNDREHAKENDYLRTILADSHSHHASSAPSTSPNASSLTPEYPTQEDIALAMRNLPTLESSNDKAALAQQIDKGGKEIVQRRKGHVIVGRVLLEGKDDPRDINSQMEILPQGYFAGPVRDLNAPVGFRLNGYAPFDLSLAVHDGLVIDVGTVQMKRLPDSELAKLAGEVELEDAGKLDTVKVQIRTDSGPINTPSGGTEPRPHYAAAITPPLDSDGRFSQSGLSPIDYDVSINAPGYVSQGRKVTLSSGAVYQLGAVKLEKPRKLSIDYVNMKNGAFDLKEVKQTVVQGGQRWIIAPNDYSWQLDFAQEKGELYFKTSYGPVSLVDLGEGEIDQFATIEPSAAQSDPQNEAVTKGHVYLLRFPAWNRPAGDRVTLFKIKNDS